MTIYGIADSVLSQDWGPSSINYRRFGITLNNGYWHNGKDLSGPVGTPIYAWEDGSTYQGYELGGFGNYVVFSARGWKVWLGHLSRYGKSGQVKKGDIIGYRGNSGNSTGPHTHVETHPPNQDRKNGALGAVNPDQYFNSIPGVQSGQGNDMYGDPPASAKDWNEAAIRNRIRWITGVEHSDADIEKYHSGKSEARIDDEFYASKEYEIQVNNLYKLVNGTGITPQDLAAKRAARVPYIQLEHELLEAVVKAKK